jgi:prevent-host-death family protein
MPRLGIRELKNRTSEVLRAVRQDKAEYIITYQGQPVARLIPLQDDLEEDIWARLERLRREITANWKSEKSAAEIVSEIRR